MLKRRTGTILSVVLLAVAAFLILRWPRMNDVETGRTPEYPDLLVRDYGQGEQAVLKATQKAVESLPRFTFVAAGSGPGGAEVQAVATTRVFKFKDDLTI